MAFVIIALLVLLSFLAGTADYLFRIQDACHWMSDVACEAHNPLLRSAAVFLLIAGGISYLVTTAVCAYLTAVRWKRESPKALVRDGLKFAVGVPVAFYIFSAGWNAFVVPGTFRALNELQNQLANIRR